MHHRHAAILAVVLAAACSETEKRTSGEDTAVGLANTDAVRKIASVTDVFRNPESVRYDPEQDVYFVSNMYGYGSLKDGNGFISRMQASDPRKVDAFIRGGANGVTLNAPKGLAIHGDTLWAADIDVLRGFDRHSGAPLATIDFAPVHPMLLNDVAIGPNGVIRVTDSGFEMTEAGVVYHQNADRVYEVGPNHAITVIASGKGLGRPNGVTWDSTANRWIMVNFDDFKSAVFAMPPHDSTRTVLATGPGRFDGVEVISRGRILYTCWNDSSVYMLERGGKPVKLVRDLPIPADIGVDTKRNLLLVPLSGVERVEVWSLPR